MTTSCRRTNPKSAPKIASHQPTSLARTKKRRSEMRSKIPKCRHHTPWRPLSTVSQFYQINQYPRTLKTAFIVMLKIARMKIERASSRVTMSGQCPRLRIRDEFRPSKTEIVKMHQNSNKSLISHALRTILIVKYML